MEGNFDVLDQRLDDVSVIQELEVPRGYITRSVRARIFPDLDAQDALDFLY